MLTILFRLFYLHFSVLYMLQPCMVGVIISILQLSCLRPEGTKELGQKYTSQNYRASATKAGGDTNFAQQVTHLQSENLAKDKLYS